MPLDKFILNKSISWETRLVVVYIFTLKRPLKALKEFRVTFFLFVFVSFGRKKFLIMIIFARL